MNERTTDILIVGGGLGGVAAALSALQLGRNVILTEETDWLGGQLTAQAVPPDEHPWIEATGCTATYRLLRAKIRDYYRRAYPLTAAARADVNLNPGQGFVSALCHEPRVALAAIDELLAPYRARRQLDVLLCHRPLAVAMDGDRVAAVTLRMETTGEAIICRAPYVIDATELGDLLALGDVEHIIGAESQTQTGELHALPAEPNPFDQQAVTWCFAIDYLPGEDHTIARPSQYDFWRTYQAPFWPARQFGWVDVDPISLAPRHLPLFGGPTDAAYVLDFWHYRRIFYRRHYPDGLYPSDITLVNWPQIDYWLGPLIGVGAEEQAQHLEACRQLSLAFLYWMQTEAPRHDGGYGYPGLRLRPDVVGTYDGLAKHVYIREARRIAAEFTVTEAHVGVEQRRQAGLDRAATFHDSVGVGSYRIDLHPSTALRTYIDISSYPFQIPLGALLPVRVENLLPGGKNLGVTHITNGCYRLHPVEWNIGAAAGAVAAFALNYGLTPRQVRNSPRHLADFQRVLQDQLGFTLTWPDYAATLPR
ncbi:MAG TPA: FAD-dependent oxidoreductase [Chloroflexi bacterium]|nr:FAD-dependent oxidoreductase [Chloroflexota bacterium]HHW88567.1 FAD-dependent oxidoreductase [Chloroflexota bacterium]